MAFQINWAKENQTGSVRARGGGDGGVGWREEHNDPG